MYSILFRTIPWLQERLGHPSSAAKPEDGPKTCVVIDGLSSLLQRHPPLQVIQTLAQLQRSASCIVAVLHTDLHPSHVSASVQHLASCVVRLHNISGLHFTLVQQQIHKTPHGLVDFMYKRRTGRVRVEMQAYTLGTGGSIDLYNAPVGVSVTAHQLVATSLAQPPAAAPMQEPVGAQPAASSAAPDASAVNSKLEEAVGGMRLSLTEAERAARERVVLPFEHQGRGKLYQTGDFKDYLPVAAGGHAAGSGEEQLGHILYVRDSSEEYDSDEDPDDDLDI